MSNVGATTKEPPRKVPELRIKLNALYEWAWKKVPPTADGKSQSGDQCLANKLNVKPVSITTYVKGNYTRGPEKVPAKHVRAICDIFGIQGQLFVGDLSEFKEWLAKNTSRPPITWRELAAQGDVDEAALSLLPALGSTRGLAFEDWDDELLPTYAIDERVAVILDVTRLPLAKRRTGPTTLGLILLSEDANKVVSLCPSPYKYAPPSVISNKTSIRLPVPEDKWIRVEAPSGTQTLYAILMQNPLPSNSDYFNAFCTKEPVSQAMLDRFADQLGATRDLGDYQTLKYSYVAR